MCALIKGGVLGGGVVFIWNAVSWMLLPWHAGTLHAFADEGAVVAAVAAEAPASGVYFLPNPHAGAADASPEERDARERAAMARRAQGPLVFASVTHQGSDSMAVAMAGSLLINVVSAGLVVLLLGLARDLGYWCRVGFVVLVALAAGVMCHLPYWNWWGFAADYTALALADLLIGWFLAALILARATPGQQA